MTSETQPVPTQSDQQLLEVADIFGPLVELGIHGQDNKLNLFSSFLFFQSILLLALATVWQTDWRGRAWILLVFSGFGMLSSVIWAELGADYADASRRFSEAGAELAKKCFPSTVPNFLEAREEIVESKPEWKRGRFLIASVTWGFFFLYPLLDLSLLWKSH